MQDGNPIPGATASTYTPAAGDSGHAISVTETATNGFGHASATSNTVSVPTTVSVGMGPVAVSLGAVPSAGIAVSDHGQAMLPLVCPATLNGCDASGVLIIHLPASLLEHSASTGTVLASFSGQHIAGGHSALIAVQLKPSVLREVQTLRMRRVKVTLTVSNHVIGGPAVITTDVLYLRIPPLSAGACPVATGQLTATTLGPVTLGATRTRERRLLPSYSARNFHTDDFCLYQGIGIRVGYASAKLLGSVTAAGHQEAMGTAVLALTANPYYTLDGIRPGSALQAAKTKLKLKAGIRVGRNTWYVAVSRYASWVLKVRDGTVQEIGAANQALTSTRAAQRALLRNF